MDTFRLKRDNALVSSSIQKLLNKKVNIYFQKKGKSIQRPRFIIPTHNELKKIKISYLKKIKIIVIAFSLLILYFTKMFVLISKNNRYKRNKLVFIFSFTKDQVFRDSSLNEFHNFLHSKKVHMTEKNEILIECRGVLHSKRYSNLNVTLDIPLKIFTTNFSLQQKIVLMFKFSRRLSTLIKSFSNSQFIYLVYKEYIFDESVFLLYLNKNQVDKVITGPGNFKYQPIIFEMPEFTGERVMMWYSSNSVPLKYKLKLGNVDWYSKLSEVFYEQMKIDTHWVWTNEHKKYLMKMTNSNVLVKGSMVFYNPPKKLNRNKKYDIIIFDVTPFDSKSIFKDTIYSFPVAKEFMEDIIESVKLVSQELDMDMNVYVKHKRAFSSTHSSDYISYIARLVRNGALSVLPLNNDLYETIAASKIVIGFPFTSPVIIGQELKIPSIHYCSTNMLSKYNKTDFIQNKFELIKYLELNLSK